MKYRLTALYDYPPVERTAVVDADTAEQAMVKAVLEKRLPVAFARDAHGWLEPVMWDAALAGGRRWPAVKGHCLEWGEGESRRLLRFYITPADEE